MNIVVCTFTANVHTIIFMYILEYHTERTVIKMLTKNIPQR